MAILTSLHCGRPETHPKHHGRFVLAGPGPHLVCDGDPEHLARQQEREANPPPGPSAPPRPIEWQPSGQDAGPEVTHLALVQASLPPGLTEVAGGTEAHCRAQLERWVAERGLRDGERALILAVAAETVVEPGVGAYTAPAGRQ